MDKQTIFKLLDNENFKEIIIDKYLGSDIKDIVFNEDLDNDKIKDKLKARQELRNFLDELINYATISEEYSKKGEW